MEPVGQSWEPIHQRLMVTFWDAMKVNAERVQMDQVDPQGNPTPLYNFEPPPGFPPGSKEFFEQMAYALIRVQMEGILRNMIDGVMTSVAKELTQSERV